MARQARYVIQKAAGVGGNPIPHDEPCIVVRAQDVMALPTLDFYLGHYREMLTMGLGDPQVVTELESHRAAVEEWQSTHPTKVADR